MLQKACFTFAKCELKVICHITLKIPRDLKSKLFEIPDTLTNQLVIFLITEQLAQNMPSDLREFANYRPKIGV